MARLFALGYGVAAYALFLAVFTGFILFTGDLLPGKTVSSPGSAMAAPLAVLVDVLLISGFGLQHTVMARSGFKQWLHRRLPPHLERSSYVVVSSVVLALLMAGWQPLPGVLWSVQAGWLVAALWTLFALGWALAAVSTFLTDHFDLFGLRQVYLHFRRRTYTPVPFRMRWLYRLVRHPMMLGMLIGFWAAVDMTWGRLLLASGMSAYIVIGVMFEERGLAKSLGEPYRAYQARTPMLLPRLRPKPSAAAAGRDRHAGGSPRA